MEFLRLFPRRHFAAKSVVASQNVGCFLRLFSRWFQGSTVVIEVWDDDSGQIAGSLHDFVDKYTLTLSQLRSADPDLQSATQQTKKLCGKRSCMTVTVTLYCGPNYLVPECRTYCMSHNDSLGHYNCNYTAGRKICHDGWYDPLSDCVKKRKICTPRNDSLGHYNCDPVSGEKLCLSGWTGENCTQSKSNKTTEYLAFQWNDEYMNFIYRNCLKTK